MNELNAGYEFTKAQIAELESLRAENAMLKSSGIDKVVKIIAETEVWKECETLRSRLAEIEKQEPVRHDWHQNPTSEQWFECPDDAQILEDIGPVKVGDVIELAVCWNGKQKFRVAKIEDEQSDDVEFELVGGTKLYATPAVSPGVDDLAQFIRQVDGENKLGAGALAEKIIDRFRFSGLDAEQLRAELEELKASRGLRHVQRLQTELVAALKDAEHKQCRIDELILEFCPSEMTADQLNRWRKCQIPAIEQAKGGA